MFAKKSAPFSSPSLSCLGLWALLSAASQSFAQATPVPEEEKRFFELYSNYQSRPTDEQLFAQSKKNQDSLSYELKEGDNLWDLSEVLFGDPQFWPKLWSLNSQSVTNPHELRRGDRLVFVPGGEQAPEMKVIQAQSSQPNSSEALSKSSSSIPTQAPLSEPSPLEQVVLEIPPPAKPPQPLRPLPQSLPNWSFRSLPEDIGSVDLQRSFLAWTQAEEVMPFQVVAAKPQFLGRVVETEYRGDFGMDQSEVLVHLKSAPAGKDLMVIQPGEQLFDPFRKAVVYERRLVGELQLLGLVNSRLKVYRARVRKTLLPVVRGAEVVEGKLPILTKPSSVASSPPTKAVRVLGGPLNPQTRYRGEKQYVFLSGGEAQGLQVGQVYGIQKFSKTRNPLTLIEENESLIGKVLIAHAEPQLATGFILESSEEVLIGDQLAALRPADEASSGSAPTSVAP